MRFLPCPFFSSPLFAEMETISHTYKKLLIFLLKSNYRVYLKYFVFQHCLFKVGSYAYPEEDLTFSNGLLKYNNSSFQQATELDYSIEEPIPLRDTRYVWHNHVNLSLTGTK